MKDSRKRFSLLENGILDQPSIRLLLVNVSSGLGLRFSTCLPTVCQGMLDELFPIEDGLLTLEHGSIKEAR